MSTPPDPLAAALRDALAAERSPVDDDALIARAIARATTRLSATSSNASTSADAEVPPDRRSARVLELSPRPRSRLVRVVLPLAAAFAASVALASVYLASRSAPVPPTPPTEPAAPTTAAEEPHEPTTTTILPGEIPSVSVNDLPRAKPSTAVTSEHVSLAPPPTDSHVTAAELFRDANAERRSGHLEKAVDLYTALQKRFPDSSETQASRVSLGRLLLDRPGNAPGALAQFDAYLNSHSTDGTLSEEARLGRALAFQRLGKTAAEQQAWQELLAQHPQSLHSTRAKERLRSLERSEGEPR